METFDQQYVRRYRQHIPFYKSEFPQQDRRVYWHHQRSLCDSGCVFGIPVVQDQYLMFVLEDPAPTDIGLIFSGVSQNTTIELCCIDDDDNTDCPDWSLSTSNSSQFSEYEICVIDGVPIQFNYMRIQVPSDASCGLHYLKIIAHDGTPNKRIWYSQLIYIYQSIDVQRLKLLKINIDDTCSIGGINWSEIYEGWGDTDLIQGHEVYLPQGVATAFVEEVTDSEFEEDGKGNEILQYEKVQYRYEFDTNLVPDFFAEMIKELTNTDRNFMNIPDNQQIHKFRMGNSQTAMTPDGDGCYMNVNVKYNVNVVINDACCDTSQCECPQDNAISVISKTTDQIDAEANVSIGDTYLVPHLGAAGPNPEWKVHDNEIAVWNGNGWDYSPNNVGMYALVEDESEYYLSLGVADVWVPNDAYITDIDDNVPVDCTFNVNGVIPQNTWAKLQYEVAGSGVWNDLDGVFYSLNEWITGQDFYIGDSGNYNFRLVHLSIGCSLENSPIFNFPTTENCV